MPITLTDQGLLKSLESSGMEKGQISRLKNLIPSLDEKNRQGLADLIGRSKELRKKEADNNTEMAKLNDETRDQLTDTGHRLAKEIRVKGEAIEQLASQDELDQIKNEIGNL